MKQYWSLDDVILTGNGHKMKEIDGFQKLLAVQIDKFILNSLLHLWVWINHIFKFF